jgi:hypothetical protein
MSDAELFKDYVRINEIAEANGFRINMDYELPAFVLIRDKKQILYTSRINYIEAYLQGWVERGD